MTLGRALLLVLAVAPATAGRAYAQQSIKSSVTTSSLTITFPTVTETDYTNTFVAATSPITLTFDSKKNAGNQPIADRTSTLSIRATTPTMGGTKPIGDLTYLRTGGSGYVPLTLSDVTIESRPFRYNGLNDPWSTTLLFRTNLTWTSTPPGTYSASVVVTLTVTTP